MANFSYEHEMAAMAQQKVLPAMVAHLFDGQPDGEKFKVDEITDTFTSPNGWWFQFTTQTTIEIKAIPESPAFYRTFKDDMQDAIFVTAANEGYFPALYQGGGHINLGLEAFEDNNLLLRNFIVDFMINHNELFMGVFNYDTNNAMPFGLLNRRAQSATLEVIEKFDKGGYPNRREFLEAIQRGINTGSNDASTFKWQKFARSGLSKYHSINFKHAGTGRIEIRGVRPQANMDVWVRQIELIEKRLLYLEKITAPLAIHLQVPILPYSSDPNSYHLNPPLDSQLALKAFYQFVKESGARWADHRDYLWPQWSSNGDLEKFETSQWFKDAEAHAIDCALALAAE